MSSSHNTNRNQRGNTNQRFHKQQYERQRHQPAKEHKQRKGQPPQSEDIATVKKMARNHQAENNAFEFIPGPRDGGFDSSSWGNYTNYYPIQNPNRNENPLPKERKNFVNNQRQQTHNSITSCEEYLTETRILQDIEAKRAIRGILRINPKQYTDAFITDPDGGSDFYIDNVRDRNRALNNDEVGAQIKSKFEWKILPEFSYLIEKVIQTAKKDKILHDNDNKKIQTQRSPSRWNDKRRTINDLNSENAQLTNEHLEQMPDEYFQRTVKVVYLFRRRHSMKAAGQLKKMSDNNPNFALFSPMDPRIPRLMIPMKDCPADFESRPYDYEKSLFVAKIVAIPIDKKFAQGELIQNLGDADTIEAQTKAILMEQNIRDEEFTEEVLKCLPLEKESWSISAEEISKRLDLRDKCIFTIDPATARDLDDALSCEKLENGLYQIGVHIADVSYFVKEQTPLDIEASERTTSVYLVERVIPMLPRLLCDRLCSLNPGEDRLVFSVIWTMDEEGHIQNESFTRSVIRSCVKLSYEHAQTIIENPNENFQPETFPPITNEYKTDDIKQRVLQLYKLSKVLRSKRSGALSLNQPKLQFQIKPDSKIPLSFSIYQQKDSHRLVEEFMLLANMQVARKLAATNTVFDKTILRRHPAPNLKTLENTLKTIKSIGIDCQESSSQDLVKIIQSIDDDSVKKLVIHLLAKSMQLAVYCCASCVANKNFSHFALNVDFYTHFTSPIRRYPDILVHRLLGAALGYNDNLYQTPKVLEQLALTCNEKKVHAKECSERSAELYLTFLIKEYGMISDEAIITGVKEESIDIYVFRIGATIRVGINNLPLDHKRTDFKRISDDRSAELTIYWDDKELSQATKQVLKAAHIVNVDIASDFDTNMKRFKLTAQLRHPNAEKLTTLANLCESSSSLNNVRAIPQRQDFDPYTEY